MHESPSRNSLPMVKAWAMPSGLALTAYESVSRLVGSSLTGRQSARHAGKLKRSDTSGAQMRVIEDGGPQNGGNMTGRPRSAADSEDMSLVRVSLKGSDQPRPNNARAASTTSPSSLRSASERMVSSISADSMS